MYKDWILSAKRIAIVMHVNPDGDALGSGLALGLALKKLGKEVELLCDTPVPLKYLFLPETQLVRRQAVGKIDLYISVDCADEGRLGALLEPYLACKNSINIDHHLTNSRYAKINIVRNTAAAAMIIYEVIGQLNVQIDKDMASLLYTAILTDTGGFLHSNTTPMCLKLAAELVEKGANNAKINFKMLKEATFNKTMLMSRAMASIRLHEGGKIAIICLREQDFVDTHTQINETEGIVNYAVNIEGVDVGICLSEQSPNSFKVALRSSGDVDVAEIAKIFGGGGHASASGCMLAGDIYEVTERLVHACKTQFPF